jgi:hypothetical protein
VAVIMANVDWGNQPETLLVWRVYSNWTTQESILAWSRVEQFLNRRAAKQTCLMIDLRQCFIPLNFLLHLRSLMDKQFPSHLPLIVVITLYSFVQPLKSIAYYIHQCRFEIVFSVDEAYRLAEPYNQ